MKSRNWENLLRISVTLPPPINFEATSFSDGGITSAFVAGKEGKLPMKRLLKNTHFHLLLLVASLFVISSIFGLSAYLTETSSYSGTFRTATGKELGFQVTGNAFEDTIVVPGDSVDLSARAEVSGSTPLYVFVKIDVSEPLTITGFSSSWHQMGATNIYYYGTATDLVAIDTNNPSVAIFDGITLSSDAGTDSSYYLTVTGYAIQTKNISSSDPAAVWSMVAPASTEP